MRHSAVATTAAIGARATVAERGALVIRALFYGVVMATVGSLWHAAAESAGGTVAGYDGRALVWYIATTEALTIGLPLRLIEQTADDITSGAVTVEMLRPAPPVAVRLATELGRSVPRVALCQAIGAAVCLVTVGGPPAALTLVLLVPALVLAVVANLAAQHAVAALAFWLRDVRSTWFLYQKLFFILGGMLLPIEVLPAGLARCARLLPFSAMAYVPGRLAAGKFEPHLLVVQLLWIVALGAGAVAAFRSGERRLQAVGG